MKSILILLITVVSVSDIRAETHQSIIEMTGIMYLRQICYKNCGVEKDKGMNECNALYLPKPPEPNIPPDPQWEACVSHVLADYYKCTEECPPIEKQIPFGIGE